MKLWFMDDHSKMPSTIAFWTLYRYYRAKKSYRNSIFIWDTASLSIVTIPSHKTVLKGQMWTYFAKHKTKTLNDSQMPKAKMVG